MRLKGGDGLAWMQVSLRVKKDRREVPSFKNTAPIPASLLHLPRSPGVRRGGGSSLNGLARIPETR